MMADESGKRRAVALLDIIELRRPVAQAAETLAKFGWDSEDELVTLTRADVARLLEAFLNGHLTDTDSRTWAEVLEGRDDVGMEPGHEDLLKRFLFEISAPEIFEPLTPDSARWWLWAMTSEG